MASKLTKIQKRIYIIRKKRIMLDSDIAELYEVEVRQLNQAVKRNIKRFPADFMFRLTKAELTEVITNCDHLQNLKYRPTSNSKFQKKSIILEVY
jgi:hypothetical protein